MEGMFAAVLAQANYLRQPGSGAEITATWGGAFTTAVACYVPLVLFTAKAVREKRLYVPVAPLKFVTFCYNVIAGALSSYGFYLMIQDPKITAPTGFYAEADYLPSTRLAINVFCFTKCFEFVDTFLHSAFKGEDPSFLHAFHHVATAIASWFAIATNCHFEHNPVVMNLFVHAVMFTYFALVAIHPSIKKALRVVRAPITGIQLVQMFAGTYNQYYVVAYAGQGCDGTGAVPEGTKCYNHTTAQWYTAYFGLVMYAIYIFLFGNFFCEQYVFKKSKDQKLADLKAKRESTTKQSEELLKLQLAEIDKQIAYLNSRTGRESKNK